MICQRTGAKQMNQFFVSVKDNQLYIGMPKNLGFVEFDLLLYDDIARLNSNTFLFGYYPKSTAVPVKASISLFNVEDRENYINIGFCSESRLIFYKQAIDYIDQKQKLINMFSDIYETNLSWIFPKYKREKIKNYTVKISTLNKLIDLQLDSNIIMKIIRQVILFYDTKYFKFIGTRMKEYVKNNDFKFYVPEEMEFYDFGDNNQDEWIISFCRLYKEKGIEPFTFYNFKF